MSNGYVQGSVGTNPQIDYQAIPSGGIVSLKLLSQSPNEWSLTRYIVSGGVQVSGYAFPLNQVAPQAGNAMTQINMLDCGDGTNQALDPTKEYLYTFTTADGTISTPALPVGATIEIVEDDLTLILIRTLQGGMRSLKLPAGFNNKPKVFHAMPLTGQPTLPMIAVNQSLVAQAAVPIGQGNNASYSQSNTNTITSLVDRIYSVAILTTTVEERDYYRDVVMSIFNTILNPIMEFLGQDVEHSFTVDCGQISKDSMMPGFYFAEMMLKFKGTFNTIVTTQYGLIESIDTGTGVITTQDTSDYYIEDQYGLVF